MLEIANDKPTPDEDIKKCLAELVRANEQGEIVGIAVALVGTPTANTVQHMAGKFNIAHMLGSIELLRDWVLHDKVDSKCEDY